MHELHSILILDDHAERLRPIQQMLEANGWTVLLVDDPQIALDLLKERKITVVLTDYEMPKLSGIDFVEYAKREFHPCHFIVMTGAMDDKIQSFCRDLGLPLLQKPFQSSELLQYLALLKNGM